MDMKVTLKPLEYFKKLAKKEAHKYAMHVVISPLAHKQAIFDVEQAFYVGAMAYRDVMYRHKETCEITPHLDILSQQAFEKFSFSYFGNQQSDELKKSIKTDIEEGVSWGIHNYSIGD